jgi:hypothetical protein
MLREPTEMLHALYYQFRVDGNEHLPTFEQALAAEPGRRAGRGFTRHTYFRQGLQYHAVARFTEQVQRYFDMFGRVRVQVVLYDDFAANTQGVYRQVLNFLSVKPTRVTEGFPVINGSQRVRLPWLRNLMSDPLVRGTAVALHAWLPARLFAALQQAESKVMQLNSRPEKRPPQEGELRRQLKKEFTPEVERLSELLGRDLSHWSVTQTSSPQALPGRMPAGVPQAGCRTCAQA